MSSAKNNEDENPKAKGNACMKSGNHVEGVIHYTHAIKQDPNDPKLYSNRSLGFLKMDQYYFALEDANKAIALDPSWAKGYYRKGEALFQAQHYKDAVNSYKRGLRESPEDNGIQEALKRAQAAYTKESNEEFRNPILGAIGGIVLGILVVLMDQTMTKEPAIPNIFVQILLVFVFCGFGFGISKLFSYIKRKTIESLLESPGDLLQDTNSSAMGDMAEEANTEISSEKNQRRKNGPSVGKQKMRKAKKS